MNITNGQCGVYVHVPFCVCKCPYCSFYSEPINSRDPAPVISALTKEMQAYIGADVATIYIGGGSPSSLAIKDLMRLVAHTQNTFPNAKEVTVEVNPSQATSPLLSSLYKSGVNRLSMGIQSFNDQELKLLGRAHNSSEALRVVDNARDVGFENISIDLMFAVPNSSLSSWEKSLQAAVKTDATHISAYSLTYERDTPFTHMRDRGEMEIVDEDTDRAMYEMAIDYLASQGYSQYEISNFARDGFQCAHNVGYWHNKSYIGIGPAAGSYYKGIRSMNTPDIEGYVKAIESNQSPASETIKAEQIDVACETMVLGLRMMQGVDLQAFRAKTGYNAMGVFDGVISSNIKSGLLEITDGKLHLTKAGIPIADKVLCDFSTV